MNENEFNRIWVQQTLKCGNCGWVFDPRGAFTLYDAVSDREYAYCPRCGEGTPTMKAGTA